ncbi:MAG: NAD-dependent epimerase/dehydratase family protein, partial [Aurantibacter sp.]
PVRLSRGGEILVPGKSDDPVQYIDVRDVAAWMIRLIEKGGGGNYNAVGPASATGMHAFVYGAHAAFSSAATFIIVDDYDFLKQHKVHYIIPWIMPVGKNSGSALINNQHAIANGLAFTPLAQTVKDTHEWWYSGALIEERRQRFESKPDSILLREESIISAWKSRQ